MTTDTTRRAGGEAVNIREEPVSMLAEHGRIPIAFPVERVLEVAAPSAGLGGITLTERAVEQPWVKDYDADAGDGPARWHQRFDTANWGLLAAHDDDGRLGGAVIAFDSPGVNMLRGRKDLAVLWDLRVRPDRRGSGVGSALFAATERWTRERGCRQLDVETQNINVPACRFYARMGCTLGAIDTFAYPDLPQETRLLWFKSL